jgi:hypothetical protein
MLSPAIASGKIGASGVGYYLREHREADSVRAVARVLGEPGRFFVRLTEGDPTSGRLFEGGRLYECSLCYGSPNLAFAAADALVRHRFGGHQCSAACTGWV